MNLKFRTIPLKINERGAPMTLNSDDRSVEVVAATENVCRVYDPELGGVIDEVLVVAGAIMPENGQLPLLDAHNRGSAAAIIGSFRNMRIENDKLVGRAYFSGAGGIASDSFQKVKEGHITDFSIGYVVRESIWIPDGETHSQNGRSYAGPVKLSTKWQPRELSIVPIGADSKAKARQSINQGENETMKTQQNNSDDQIRAERMRIGEITGMCEKFDFPKDEMRKLIDNGSDLETARKAVLEHVERTKVDPMVMDRVPLEVGVSGREKRANAAIDGLVMRAGVALDHPAPGANEYRNITMVDFARECLVASGESVRGLPTSRIIDMALQQRSHTTSDFPYLLANSANKVLRETYFTFPSTWRQWCRLGTARDFKTMYRVALSNAPELQEVPENTEYKHISMSEDQESFAIVKKGNIFWISREALINDDLSAFETMPRAFSMAAARTVNSTVYGILTANAAMADGTALFHADHDNLASGGDVGAPAKATLKVARAAMRLQTGLADEVLGIAPKFLIHPASLETDVDELLESLGTLESDKSSGVVNVFYKKLIPVTEPVLDADSTTGWYLAADPSTINTLEVAFLNGVDGPYLETRNGFNVDGMEFKCRIEYGAKAIDHRGLYSNPGA